MRLLVGAVLLLGLGGTATAQEPLRGSWYDGPWRSLRDPSAPTWYAGIWKNWADTFGEGATSVLVPVNTLHLPFAYTSDQIEQYTQWPVGVGLGRTRMGDTSSRTVFAMVLQDSLGAPQYQLGYVWMRNWRPVAGRRSLRLGLGYTLDLLVREDSHYIPYPVLLPVVSVAFKRLSVGTTYVPGKRGYGNLLVTGAHFSL